MKHRRILLGAAALSVALAASGCGHRLVVQDDETTVKVYQSEEIYGAAAEIRKALQSKAPMTDEQKNFVRMLDTMVETGELKECEAGARVKLVSTSNQGAQVEVLDGPNKGYTGFVAKGNFR